MKRFTLALLCCLSLNANADLFEDNEVFKWVGVEVVTKDISSIPKIRELTKISPGMTAAITDPVLPQACQYVRKAYPLRTINCQVISMESGTALYAIEVNSKNEAIYAHDFKCNKSDFLSRRFRTLEANSIQIFEDYLKTPDSVAVTDIINTNNALDSNEPNLSAKLNEIFIELKGQLNVLKKGVSSCNPKDRAAAIQLFNYSGQPVLATKMATKLMLDPDSHVRNNATRLLSVFVKFVPPSEQAQLIINACKLIDNPSFTDRNKGLALIAEITKENNSNDAPLPHACLHTIREIQKISICEQLGGYAARILEQFKL